MNELGKLLIIGGSALVLVGALILGFNKLGFMPLGRLPGDIHWEGKNSSIYIPITSCLVVSALFSLLSWLLGKR